MEVRVLSTNQDYGHRRAALRRQFASNWQVVIKCWQAQQGGIC